MVAGAYLSIEAAGTFERGFTAGRGFTALAIMIFGAWNPVGAFAAALFFGLTQGVASQLQADEVIDIPPQFINMLPYRPDNRSPGSGGWSRQTACSSR